MLNQALQQFETVENQEAAIAAKGLTLAVDLLNQKYELIATNVPYLSRGKQCEALQDFTERHYENAKGDIANVFLERCLELNTSGGVTQMVMPQNWLFLGSYKKQREHLLKQVTWNLLAGLGTSSFQTPMYDFNVQLLTLTKATPNNKHLLTGVDASAPKTVQKKAAILENGQLSVIGQALQLKNPDLRIDLECLDNSSDTLSSFVTATQGSSPGDTARFRFNFWEIQCINEIDWMFFQSTPTEGMYHCGLSYIVKDPFSKEVQEQHGFRLW